MSTYAESMAQLQTALTEHLQNTESMLRSLTEAIAATHNQATALETRVAALEADTPDIPDTTPPITPAPANENWLRVQGNKFIDSSGAVWVGRGVNVHDCRSCDACEGVAPADMQRELRRRVDFAIGLGANFFRLCLESGENNLPYERDPDYRQSTIDLVSYIGSKGCRVLVAPWDFKGLIIDDQGVPTDAAIATWMAIAADLADQGHVLYGLCNEPEQNYAGADDARRIAQYVKLINAIRSVESSRRKPNHIIVVQALGGWSSNWGSLLRYNFGDTQIAYEVHEYSHVEYWDTEVFTPAQSKAVIVGEFGPAPNGDYMTNAETRTFMTRMRAAGITWAAWTLHMRCPPNLLVDNSNWGCGRDMVLALTPWGQAVADNLR